MQNRQLIKAKKIIKKHGFEIPDEVLLEALQAALRENDAVYDRNDFVAYYEGMGEMGHGLIKKRSGGRYTIEPYFSGKPCGYTIVVMNGDMRGLSSIEDSLKYEHIRGGGS